MRHPNPSFSYAIAAVVVVLISSLSLTAWSQGGLGKRALALIEELEACDALNDRVEALYEGGKYAAALELAKEAVSTSRKLFGGKDLRTLRSINMLAMIYRESGDLARAEPLFLKELASRRKVLDSGDPELATSVSALAVLYLQKGDLPRAEPLLLESLAISREAFGEDNPNTASAMSNLAKLYAKRGEHDRAEPLLREALKISREALGDKNPSTATTLSSLAGLLMTMGDQRQAEPLLLEALTIRREAQGDKHPYTAISMADLGVFYARMGDLERAEPLLVESLAIKREVLGGEHPGTAATITALGVLFASKGEFERAEALHVEALAIARKARGAGDLTGSCLNNLAALYQRLGDARAEPLLREALKIRRRVLGDRHPDTAVSINNLAVFYGWNGDLEKAAPLLGEALGISRSRLGDDHPSTAILINNVSSLHQAMGDFERALQLREEGDLIRHRLVDELMGVGSERQKTALLRTLADNTDGDLSLHLEHMLEDERAAKMAFNALLHRKGRALEAQVDTMRALREGASPAAAEALDKWKMLRRDRATLALRRPGLAGLDAYQRRLEDLGNRIDEAEELLGQMSERFVGLRAPITIEGLAASLPAGAALVEFSAYDRFIPGGARGGRWGARHFGVYVLRADGSLAWARLGEAADIEAKVRALRQEIVACSTEAPCDWDESAANVAQLARALDEALLGPISADLEGVDHVIFAPDGELNHLPFEVLVDKEGRFRAQTMAMTYVTSGRELLSFGVTAPPKGGPLVMADPDYDYDGVEEGPAGPQPVGDTLRSRAMAGVKWGRLEGTAKEAQAISSLFSGAETLTGAAAREGALSSAEGPSVLHIATHGFFLKGEPDLTSTGRGFKTGLRLDIAEARALVEDPLLRSGLVLAGANTPSSAGYDGVLTASEAAGIDLWGTRLVVLSACETGLGHSEVGHGVYGLRRAFALAGAESQVFSLWKVADDATEVLMTNFYLGLARGEGRTEAMLGAKRAFISRDDRWSHPYFWAAFLSSGRWTPMDPAIFVEDVPAVATGGPAAGGCAGCSLAPPSPAGGAPWVVALLVVAALRRRGRAARGWPR